MSDSRPTDRRPDPRELETLARRRPDEVTAALGPLSVREQAELALRVAPEARLSVLLHAPRPMRLVRAIPDFDLYMTIREVGPSDALPLIRLASNEQLRHLFDLESWRGDRFDPRRCGAWLALLVEAGDAALRRFLRSADDELLALLFAQWIRVEQLEYEDSPDRHGHGMTERGEVAGAMTPDGEYRFTPLIAEHAAAIHTLLQSFFVDQPERYRRLLWASSWELPAHLEEEALRWRLSRLEEHGFPGPDEAREIYQPPRGTRVVDAAVLGPTDPDGLSGSRVPLRVLGDDPLARGIDRLDDGDRDRVLGESIALANRVLAADDADTGDPEVHRTALGRAAGYVRVALESRGSLDPGTIADVLRHVPVVELFREGYERAAALARAAHTLRREGWAATHTRALELLDSPVRERVAALLLPRPMFVPVGTDAIPGAPRDFRDLGELDQTRVALELAETVGRLFVEHLGLDPGRSLAAEDATAHGAPRFSTLLLTVLAWHAVRGEPRGEPLPADVVADFLRNVASRRTAAPDAPARALEMLVRLLAERFGLGPRDVAIVQAFGRSGLELLAAECAGLDPGVPVDPRFVSCLLLRRD